MAELPDRIATCKYRYPQAIRGEFPSMSVTAGVHAKLLLLLITVRRSYEIDVSIRLSRLSSIVSFSVDLRAMQSGPKIRHMTTATPGLHARQSEITL